MTESEWLTSTDPAKMISVISGGIGTLNSWKASDRKLRLFACACCRYMRSRLDKHSREAVLVAERYADGGASKEELSHARWKLAGNSLSFSCLQQRASDCPISISLCKQGALQTHQGIEIPAPSSEAQCNILRDLLGNPYHPVRDYPCCEGVKRVESIPGDARTLIGGTCPTHGSTIHMKRWLTPTVLEIANHAYDNRDFTGLPYLGDALEEAGCTDQRILHHLRDLHTFTNNRPIHSRGCWVLDLILCKE